MKKKRKPRKKRYQRIERSAAVVTIRDAAGMTKRGRRDVAAWLRRSAGWLERHGDQLAGTFRARYLYA